MEGVVGVVAPGVQQRDGRGRGARVGHEQRAAAHRAARRHQHRRDRAHRPTCVRACRVRVKSLQRGVKANRGRGEKRSKCVISGDA